MPPSERLGCYAGREKASHADPSIDSFLKGVGDFRSMGAAIRRAEAKFDELTTDEIVYWRKEHERYKKLAVRLRQVEDFVFWARPGESFKDFKARRSGEALGLSEEDIRRTRILREAQAERVA